MSDTKRDDPRDAEIASLKESVAGLLRAVDLLGGLMGDSLARVTNLEVLMHVRLNSAQGITGLSWAGGFSPSAYAHVVKMTQEKVQAVCATNPSEPS